MANCTDETAVADETWTCEYGYEHCGDHQPEFCARMAVFG